MPPRKSKSADAHPGFGFKKARAALRSPTHVTDENVTQLVLGLGFAVDFILRHYEGGANVLGPTFELLVEIGRMEKEEVETVPDRDGEREGVHLGPLATKARSHGAVLYGALPRQ